MDENAWGPGYADGGTSHSFRWELERNANGNTLLYFYTLPSGMKRR